MKFETPAKEGAARRRPVWLQLWGPADTPVMSALSVHPTRCWNAIGAKSSCALCRDVCTASSIRLAPTPTVAADKCNSCGLCVAVCPTGAFTFPRMFQQGRMRAPAEKPGVMKAEARAVILTCPATPHAQPAPPPRGQAPLVCLAALDAGHLLALSLRGAPEVRIDAGRCAGCRVAGGLGHLQNLAIRTQALLESLRLPGKVVISKDCPQREEHEALGALFSEVGFSRRELFARLKKGRSAHGAEGSPLRGATRGLRGPCGDVPGAAPRARAKQMPESRKLLRRLMGPGAMFATAPKEPHRLPIRFVRVRPQCRLCESCARNWPGGALEWQAHAKGVSLAFHPYRCLGCGLCEKICPHGLLESRPLQAEDFPLRRRLVLRARRKVRCTACERPFLPADRSEVCSTCRRLKTLDREMLEVLAW